MSMAHPVLQQMAARGLHPARLISDSRQVCPGDAFVAYRGESTDGRNFIPQALQKGAAAVLWEPEGFNWDETMTIPNFSVRGLRDQVGEIASAFYGEPAQHLWVVGITGTNGKTSCSHWLARAYQHLGKKSAIIGTLGNGFAHALQESANTTPDPIVLQGLLADYVRQGASSVAMEVSSHGLAQGRVSGMKFDIAVFTNLSRDHLDYHGDMAAYAAAKRKLFEWPQLRGAIINIDDEFGAEIANFTRANGIRTLTYGFGQADIQASQLRLDETGLRMQVQTPAGKAELHAALMGRFNAMNLLAVLGAMLASDVALDDAVKALSHTVPVAGRMQKLGGGDLPVVIVDYAHTPDALEKVLGDLRAQTRGRLICVFGCGGNRDKGKRPLMAHAASRLADITWITSDNPRHETPETIIHDIVAGMQEGSTYSIETDRAAAIRKAIHAAQPGDIVLLAGKGHEHTQQIGDTKLPFSDAAVAGEVLQHMKAST